MIAPFIAAVLLTAAPTKHCGLECLPPVPTPIATPVPAPVALPMPVVPRYVVSVPSTGGAPGPLGFPLIVLGSIVTVVSIRKVR